MTKFKEVASLAVMTLMVALPVATVVFAALEMETATLISTSVNVACWVLYWILVVRQ